MKSGLLGDFDVDTLMACGRSSVVERRVPNAKVEGSNPFARFGSSLQQLICRLPRASELLETLPWRAERVREADLAGSRKVEAGPF